jgi:large conductance mechanosensitive channel
MWKEFKEFIAQGNVVDAAIGIVLGLAFKSIIDSVVNDIIMPIVGIATAGYDLTAWKIVLREGAGDATPEIAIGIGTLLQTVISFLIIAFVLFLIVKGLNKVRSLRKKEEALAVEAAAPGEETRLLSEIRDLLKERNQRE